MQTKNLIITAIHTTTETMLAALSVIFTIILIPGISYAQVDNPSGTYHFRNNTQKIYGNGNNIFECHSASGTLAMRLYNGDGESMGELYSEGSNFGLKNKNRQWSYQASDNSTRIFVNGYPKMVLMANDYVGIARGGYTPEAQLHIGQRLTMNSATADDGGWIGNNISRNGTSFKRIYSGTTADMNFTQDGRIIFRTSGISNTKSSTGKSILRNRVHWEETDYEFFSIQVNSENGSGFHLDTDGHAVIGTNDPCQLLDTEDTSIKLSVVGQAAKAGSGFWIGVSDKRLKKNIAPMGESLNKLMKVKLYGYQYKNSGLFRYGVMAQEMQDVFPHSVGKMGRSN